MSKEKNGYAIHALPVLEDNIVWVLTSGTEALVVDPTISGPIKNWLKENKF